MGKRIRSEELVFGYKAFDPNFAWEQIQYKVGIVYTCGGVEDRSNWFGFCRGLPLDVVRAYGLLDRETVLPLRFAAVSAVKKSVHDDWLFKESKTPTISINWECPLECVLEEQVNKLYQHKGELKKLYPDRDIQLVDGDVFSGELRNTTKDQLFVSNRGMRIALTYSGVEAVSMKCYTTIASVGDTNILYAMGLGTSMAVSGRYTNIAAFCESIKIASSSDDAEILAVGGSVRLLSGGDAARIYVKGASPEVSLSGAQNALRVIGDRSRTLVGGGGSQVWSVGDKTAQAVAGQCVDLTVTGELARTALVGDYNSVVYKGEGGVIALLGEGETFSGSKGTLVSAVVYDKHNKPIDIITGRVGEDGLKPDTLYAVYNGKFKEAKNKGCVDE